MRPRVRRLTAAVLGPIGALLPATTAGTATAAVTTPEEAPMLRLLGGAGTGSGPELRLVAGPLDLDGATHDPGPLTDGSRAAPRDDVSSVPPAAPDGATHEVRPGEHLWRIAELHAGERPVAEYWSELIELNRSGLVDPDDPDLILPGQVLRLP